MFESMSRLKMAVFGCLLFFAEAVIGGIWPLFPFIALIGAQGGLILGYFGAKSYTDSRNGVQKPYIVSPPVGGTEGK